MGNYLGRGLDKISNIEILDNITFDGSSSYSITKGSVAFTPNSAQSLLISIDGVVQATNFTVNSSTIDFGVAVPSTSTCNFFLHYGTGVMTVPSDGSVTTAKLGGALVTPSTLDVNGNELILDADADTSIKADTDDQITLKTGGTNAVIVDGSQNLKFNSGYGSVQTAYGCRAWVHFKSTGTFTVNGSGNVSSVSDNGVGVFVVNFATSLPDGNFQVSGGHKRVSANAEIVNILGHGVNSVNVEFFASGSVADTDYLGIAVHR